MSALAAALATYETADFIPAQVRGVVIAAARERLRLSRIPCETCGGTGRVVKWEPIPGVPRGGVSGYQTWMVENPCPSCGGSGEVWPAELVEIVKWNIRNKMGGYDVVSRAVLDALDLWAKEAK